jgi:hypothetical protein
MMTLEAPASLAGVPPDTVGDTAGLPISPRWLFRAGGRDADPAGSRSPRGQHLGENVITRRAAAQPVNQRVVCA